jgi:hypothetical protein
MADVGSYRVRWAVVNYGNGRKLSREIMCIAERRYRWLGWWPIRGADWALSEAEARSDIDRDRALRRPLPPTAIVA